MAEMPKIPGAKRKVACSLGHWTLGTGHFSFERGWLWTLRRSVVVVVVFVSVCVIFLFCLFIPKRFEKNPPPSLLSYIKLKWALLESSVPQFMSSEIHFDEQRESQTAGGGF